MNPSFSRIFINFSAVIAGNLDIWCQFQFSHYHLPDFKVGILFTTTISSAKSFIESKLSSIHSSSLISRCEHDTDKVSCGDDKNISRSFYNIKFNLIQRDRYGDKDKGEI